MFEVGINVLDERGQNKLFIPAQTMVCMMLNLEALRYTTVAVVKADNQLLTNDTLQLHRHLEATKVQWCSATQGIVAELLFEHPPQDPEIVETATDTQVSAPLTTPPSLTSTISSTVLWGSPQRTDSSTLSSSQLRQSLQLRLGAGGKRRRVSVKTPRTQHLSLSSSPGSHISVCSSPRDVEDLSDDSRPLTDLLQSRTAQLGPQADHGVASSSP
eukprot:2236861-Amphidinium_carterae.1